MTANDNSGIERGHRLRWLRKLAKLKRDELAKLANVSRASLSYWENASLSELSQSGAEKVTRAIQKLGIDCSVEWLLFGIGMQPHIRGQIEKASLDNHIVTLNQEINLFLSNTSSVTLQIISSVMSPFYEVGDIVGGVWTDPSVCKGKELLCIVNYENRLQARKVKASTIEGRYDLSYLSFTRQFNEPFELKDTELSAVAPIIRFWKIFS